MKLLIANKFEENGLAGLRGLGCEVAYQPDLIGDALALALSSSGARVLVVRGTRVTAEMLTGSLALIVRAGAGVNTIDVKAATARGIQVANCPGKNAIAVAELTMALILALDRRLPDNVAALRAGTWNKKEFSKARGLFGRTLGLLGIGPIAVEVAKRAAAFGMPLVIWSRRFDGRDESLSESTAAELGLELERRQVPMALAPSPAEVAARSDVLSVHLALGPETRGLVGAEVLGRLKPGSLLVNTARGDVVDPAALAEAVRSRGIRAGLDVFALEPPASTGAFADPIVQEPGVYGTHHIGASTGQAQEAIAREVVRIVGEFMRTGQAPNAVTG